MKRVLVTGAQGLIGRYLTARLLREDPEIRVLGIGRSPEVPGSFTHSITAFGQTMRAPFFEPLDERYRYRQIALGDVARAVDEFEPDCVFHLASALHAASERELFESNVQGTSALLDAIGSVRLVHGSSGSVYGAPVELPLRESHPCHPADAYGRSKLAAEQLVTVKAKGSYVIARIFNVVGPGQAESHVCGRLAAQLASGAATLRTGTLDTTRDFIDVRDVAKALVHLQRHGANASVYNVASGVETSIRTVVEELLAISHSQARVVSQDGPPAGVARHFADIGKLGGFQRDYTLPQSLADVFHYYLRLAPSHAA